jgi:AcrR family transcriptional regulator
VARASSRRLIGSDRTLGWTLAVGMGTLYRHFPTRDALVWALYSQEVDALDVVADQLLAELPPAYVRRHFHAPATAGQSRAP